MTILLIRNIRKNMVSEQLKSVFGGKVRVRVMGLLIEGERVLLLNHLGVNRENEFWCPPGGGVEPGESLRESLIREFKEETDLDVEIKKFVGFSEFISDPLHAVEFFFVVQKKGGTLTLGSDPEFEKHQTMQAAHFLSYDNLKKKHKECRHSIFETIDSLSDFFSKEPFFHFKESALK